MIHRLIGGFYIIVLLAGCANAADPRTDADSPVLPANVRIAAKATTLLYVANPNENAVGIYTYANGRPGKHVATISIPDPTGLCTDRAGDAYVVSYSGHRVTEFLHGQTSPKHSIPFRGYPYACAIDQSNDDLAVSVQTPHGKFYRGAYVQVFAGGGSRPVEYVTQDGFARVYFLAYDNQHDLFATAESCNQTTYCNYGSNGGAPGLFELVSGAQFFNEVYLGSTTLQDPTGVAWIKPTLLVVDANYKKRQESVGLKIYITNSKATVVGTVPFTATQAAQGVVVRAGVALVADAGANAVQSYTVTNGTLLATLQDKTGSPLAVAISQ